MVHDTHNTTSTADFSRSRLGKGSKRWWKARSAVAGEEEEEEEQEANRPPLHHP